MGRRGYQPATPTSDIIAMYEAGFSLRKIAHYTGRTHQAIAQRLRLAGITLRPRGQAKYARRSTAINDQTSN